MTGAVDRLERLGHLDRERDPADRRRVIVRASATAHRVAQDFFGPLGGISREIAASFSPTEQHVALRYLCAITDAIDQHTEGSQSEP